MDTKYSGFRLSYAGYYNETPQFYMYDVSQYAVIHFVIRLLLRISARAHMPSYSHLVSMYSCITRITLYMSKAGFCETGDAAAPVRHRAGRVTFI